MPMYSYKCEECGYAFDEVHSISERRKPETQPCFHCQRENSIKIQINGGAIVSGVRSPLSQTGDEWKSFLKETKKKYPGNRINV